MNVIIDDDTYKLLDSLNAKEYAKCLWIIGLLEEHGQVLGMPQSRYISDGLLELRVHGKMELRMFYFFHNKSAFIIHSFIKKTQNTPSKELRVALKKKNEHLRNYNL